MGYYKIKSLSAWQSCSRLDGTPSVTLQVFALVRSQATDVKDVMGSLKERGLQTWQRWSGHVFEGCFRVSHMLLEQRAVFSDGPNINQSCCLDSFRF